MLVEQLESISTALTKNNSLISSLKGFGLTGIGLASWSNYFVSVERSLQYE